MDTFLAQVWALADELFSDGILRGVVGHVATGTETPFRGDQEVLDSFTAPRRRRNRSLQSDRSS